MKWTDAKEPPNDMRPVLCYVPPSMMGSVQETPDEWHVVYFKRGAYHLQSDDHYLISPSHWTELEKP